MYKTPSELLEGLTANQQPTLSYIDKKGSTTIEKLYNNYYIELSRVHLIYSGSV